MPPNFSGLLAKAKGPAMAMPAMDDAEAEDPKRERVLPIADDLIAALAAKDREAVADALIAAHEACGGMGGEYSTESEE